jgi:hypothetical protein
MYRRGGRGGFRPSFRRTPIDLESFTFYPKSFQPTVCTGIEQIEADLVNYNRLLVNYWVTEERADLNTGFFKSIKKRNQDLKDFFPEELYSKKRKLLDEAGGSKSKKSLKDLEKEEENSSAESQDDNKLDLSSEDDDSVPDYEISRDWEDGEGWEDDKDVGGGDYD